MKLFLNACGLPDVLRLRVEDKSRNEATLMSFQRPYVLIGRSSDCDLVLDHWQVSRRHCYLQVVDGRLFCLDLGSRTGTHWEGGPSRWKWLPPDKSIHIGPHRIWFDRQTEDEVPTDVEGDSGPVPLHELPGAKIEAVDDSGEDDWRLDSLVTLMGRSPACQIRVSDPNVSKLHASLIHTAMGVWLIDLLGIGGISVNQTRVRCARLSHGDEFSMGKRRYRLSYDDPAAMAEIVDDEPYEAATKEVVPYGKGMNVPGFSPAANVPGPNQAAYGQMFDPDQMPESVAIAQALLAPMMQQFSMMQQQMFENFHHMMMTMMQSMQGMHRDHMDLVNRELEEVRRLTRELHALQAEAMKAQAAPVAPAPPPPPPPTAAPTAKPSQAAKPASPPRPMPPPSASESKKPHAPPQPRPSATPPPAADSASAAATARPSPKTAKPENPSSRPARPLETHAQIQQRILTLQTERQTRWQKILSMVGGGGEPRV